MNREDKWPTGLPHGTVSENKTFPRGEAAVMSLLFVERPITDPNNYYTPRFLSTVHRTTTDRAHSINATGVSSSI